MKPDHPDAAQYQRHLTELKTIEAQLADLEEQREALLRTIPCGQYTTPHGRFKVALVRDSYISTVELRRQGIHQAVIDRARVNKGYRKKARLLHT